MDTSGRQGAAGNASSGPSQNCSAALPQCRHPTGWRHWWRGRGRQTTKRRARRERPPSGCRVRVAVVAGKNHSPSACSGSRLVAMTRLGAAAQHRLGDGGRAIDYMLAGVEHEQRRLLHMAAATCSIDALPGAKSRLAAEATAAGTRSDPATEDRPRTTPRPETPQQLPGGVASEEEWLAKMINDTRQPFCLRMYLY
jgi:hypothetical protein